MALSFLWNAQHTNVSYGTCLETREHTANKSDQTSATNLTQPILDFATSAVLAACDTLDGVADGVLENPLACNFSIDSLACTSSQIPLTNNGSVNCLTNAQISAVHGIYSGPVNSHTDKQLYPGFSLGSEAEWILQEGVLANAFTIPILQNLVYDNLSYDAETFNWASDVQDLNRRAGRLIDEISPDLSAFRDHGGKMLVTQGWADPFNAALWPIEHLHQIEAAMGGNASVEEWFELFMVPGGGHCGAATSYPQVPAVYDVVPALVKWVEEGVVPGAVKSMDPPDEKNVTRKLCPWPKNAVFEGGDEDDWKCYVCE